MTIDEYIKGLRNKIPYALILTDSDFRRSTDFTSIADLKFTMLDVALAHEVIRVSVHPERKVSIIKSMGNGQCVKNYVTRPRHLEYD